MRINQDKLIHFLIRIIHILIYLILMHHFLLTFICINRIYGQAVLMFDVYIAILLCSIIVMIEIYWRCVVINRVYFKKFGYMFGIILLLYIVFIVRLFN